VEYVRKRRQYRDGDVAYYAGALNDEVEEAYRFYHVPASNTAVGNIVLLNRS
jgi:hypothetical protein